MATYQEVEDHFKEAFGIPVTFKNRIHRKTPATRAVARGTDSASDAKLSTYQMYLDRLIKQDARPTKGLQVYSSVHGKIQALLFSIPHYDTTYTLPKDTICDIIEKFDPSVRVFIFSEHGKEDINRATGSGLKKDLKDLSEKFGDRLFLYKAVSGDMKFSQWVRDPFVIAKLATGDVTLVEPFKFSRHCPVDDLPGNNPCTTTALNSDDRDVAENISQHARSDKIQPKHTETTLLFHGGNMLFGDDFVLIGSDFFAVNQEIRADIKREFDQQPDKFTAINERDTTFLLDEHETLKAFEHQLTPGNNSVRVIKIGCPAPSSFRPAAGEQVRLTHDGNTYLSDWLYTGKEQAFFHIDLFILPIGRKSKSSPYEILMPQIVNASGVETSELYLQIIFPWNKWIRDIANQLMAHGFVVDYLPAPLTYFHFPNSQDDRHWFVFTYHNCLMEIIDSNSDSKREIWMPTYGTDHEQTYGKIVHMEELAKWDDIASQLLKDKGIKVNRLRNYIPHALQGGGVHCLTNYLQRT